MLDYLRRDFHPQAAPDAIVKYGPARFTVLTPQLIRIEYDPDERFEDRPTQAFWNRDLPMPPFTNQRDGDQLILETAALRLTYTPSERGFNFFNLQIQILDSGTTWRYDMENKSNLGGTIRTLDEVNGAIELKPGLISRNGWAIVDDSHSLVFDEQGWLAARDAHEAAKDLYFFGYGRNYTDCIVDFQKLSGETPIVPRFALGNWWSRYWAYRQDELLGLMQDFKAHRVPLSVCIVDMDWHIVDTGNESSGWTGYTWNRDLFPKPDDFLDEIHALGLKTALNLHPASGVHSHEDAYPDIAERLGVDPETEQPIPFDIANPAFTEAYFDCLHHPLEAEGVDFWWMDWQQGTNSSIAGLDPLFWLNHLHFYDRARNGKQRPFIFSRWGGLGSQRYPIGFSGDTIVSWESLKFQPYFTATAANVSYGWWSHDIGGHMGGVEEAELYLRWLQYGVFSPILRLHSTNNPFHERRPWGFDAETTIHATQAMQLRHALIPYLYTAAWRNYRDGTLPIRPLYHLYPDEPDAYHCPNQYTFGSELIAAPFTSPRDSYTQSSRQVVWLPEGDWFNFTTGEKHAGKGWAVCYGDLGDIPVFAKAGAIIPMGPMTGWDNVSPPKALTVRVFPGADNVYELYEDDGETTAYRQGDYALTRFEQRWSGSELELTITPPAEAHDYIPSARAYQVIFYAIEQPEAVKVSLDGKPVNPQSSYDAHLRTLTLTNLKVAPGAELRIQLEAKNGLMDQTDWRKRKLAEMLKRFKLNAFAKQRLDLRLDAFLSDPTLLLGYADYMTHPQLLAFIETWLGTQPEIISDNPDAAFNRIINQLYGH